jgi:MraZ protein
LARRFRGESVHKVDQKGRVSVPASFRRVLEEGDPDWAPGLNPSLIIIYGRRNKRCLEGYSIGAMEEVENEIGALPRFSREREILERMLSTKSIQAQLDENGRIVLSAKLREMTGIEEEAVFAGMMDKFRIWAPDAYAADEHSDETWMDEQGIHDAYALLDRLKSSASR